MQLLQKGFEAVLRLPVGKRVVFLRDAVFFVVLPGYPDDYRGSRGKGQWSGHSGLYGFCVQNPIPVLTEVQGIGKLFVQYLQEFDVWGGNQQPLSLALFEVAYREDVGVAEEFVAFFVVQIVVDCAFQEAVNQALEL